MKKSFTLIILTLFVFVSMIDSAMAIPAFARKYAMSCQTCHAPFPKLKPYGDEFAGNGFVVADKETPRYYVPTGDDQLSLLREIPFALRLEAYATYNNLKSERLDFSAPYILKLLSGGALTDDVAYYFYFFFSERGEIAGIEDAFIMFNNLFGSELDLYVGQFQVSDPLFKRELRLTFEDYQIYKSKPALSRANLTYDRGIMLTYGFDTGTDIIFEVLNGSGIGGANNFRIFDDDKYKNFFGRVSQDIIEGVRIGAFGYTGKEELGDGIDKFTNTFTMWGPDLTLAYKDNLEFNFQYAFRKDDKPAPSLKNVETKGLFGELIYMPKGDESKWYATALYNQVDSDLADLKYKTGALSLGYMLKRNIRLIGEYSYNFHQEYGQLAVGIISAF